MALMQRNYLCDFYEDAEIFITGGTGVIGKVFIECVLRLCNVRCIYILLRSKKNVSVEHRLDKLRNNKVFRRLRTEKPNELQKLVPIAGDMLLPNLGVADEVVKRLENVSLVYHCAATIRFDEPLKVALNLNVGGTLNAINLAKTFKHLKLFMHVSTFYSNPYLYDIDQKIYPAPMDWKFCLNLVNNNYNDDIVNALTSKLITGFPNTYTFTKNLAEALVNDFRNELPVAVVRPSIVIFSAADPEPGYPSALSGIMGLFALISTGILKTVYMSPDCMLDIIPQDICTKFMVYYTYKATEEYKRGALDTPVYNLAMYNYNMQPFKHTIAIIEEYNLFYKHSPIKSILLPGAIFTGSKLYYAYLSFTKQLTVALLVDGLLMLSGRKPALMSIMRKIVITQRLLTPFTTNNFISSKADFKDFLQDTRHTPFNIAHLLWFSAIKKGPIIGSMLMKLREIPLNEDLSTIKASQKIYKAKFIIYHLLRAFVVYKLLCLLYRSLFSAYL